VDGLRLVAEGVDLVHVGDKERRPVIGRFGMVVSKVRVMGGEVSRVDVVYLMDGVYLVSQLVLMSRVDVN
jgi:hypothetical protein